MCCLRCTMLDYAGFQRAAYVEKITQQVVGFIRSELELSTKALPVRPHDSVKVPIQLDNSMACGYHTAFNFAWALEQMLKANNTSFIQYGEQCVCSVVCMYVHLGTPQQARIEAPYVHFL